MGTDMKYSIKDAFKSAFKVYGQNFFVVIFAFMVFFTILACIFFPLIFVSVGILDNSTTASILAKLRTLDQLLTHCVSFISLNLVSFLLVSAFLPAFRGSKIKFRNYFPNFKKVFKALLVTIALAAVPLGISIFFADFLVKNGALFDTMVSILRGMLVFFYIEILSGESILQSIRNIQEPLSKTIPFFILLGFINFVVCVIPLFIPFHIIAESNMLLDLTLGIAQFFVILPLSTLALMDAYTQLLLPKTNT